ncbi:DrmB family protein [Amycolatopsis japonica]|uniref:DrmB family protein n=1 Tax=Amycolatopsis japonica TaxID=208439 RepID=UPI00380D3500
MTPPPSSRRGGAGRPARPGARKLGAVRRSQLVTTYGVGAMIAIDNESFIVSGIDSWNIDDAPKIEEGRLANVLPGVAFFRLPPAPDPEYGVDGVRVRRFPDFYSCPGCDSLQPYSEFNCLPGRARCSDCNEDLVPSRFVLACDDGHIDDFPYWKWVHRGNALQSGFCGGKLTLKTEGSAASLRSVVVSCSCGVQSVSMEGAFRVKALKDLGIRCEGRRPWLSGAKPQPCVRHPRTMQRGSSSAWHPVMRSALSIPPWGEGLHKLLVQEKLIDAPESVIRWHFEQRPALLKKATIDEVLTVAREIAAETHASDEFGTSPVDLYGDLRKQEYERLRHGNPERHSAEWQDFICERSEGDLAPVRELGLAESMLVKRLREVRALQGFTRGVAPLESEPDQRLAALHQSEDINWLPAIEVKGEGVFLGLDEGRLREWESKPEVINQVEQMRLNHLALIRERTPADSTVKTPESPVSPRFVLLHTLAHVLINEWSLDGGYPASALRERLYASDSMAGILLYTATSDSAGSLGGIVAQGDPKSLAETLRSALARASWCSNDPLCMESGASGADSVNLAACHACVLLPETSCELNNSFLDRTLLIGAPAGGVPGYFQSLRTVS